VEDGSEEDQEQHGGGEDQEQYGGGEDQEQYGGGEDEEEEGDEEDLSEDEGLGNLPFEPDPNLVWEAPAEHQYVAAVERLRPRDKRPYQRGKTQLPSLKEWRYSHVVLEPAGRRYMLILAFRYRNFVIIKIIITYILMLSFHGAVRSSLKTRRRGRHVGTRTSLGAYLEGISLG
jgi:hypothetical protein